MIGPNDPCGQELPRTPFALQLQETAKREGIPISGTFELTPRCNFNCKMCYVHLAADRISQFGQELPVEEWIRLAEEARDAGMLYLCITGGEPLLYRDFEKFYRAVSQMGFEITLQTNASRLKGKVLELLDECPPNLVKITVYGSKDDVYEAVCGVKHGFADADAGIRALKDLRIPVLLVTTVIKQNKDDLPRIAAYAQSLQLPWIYTATVHPSIRGAETETASFLQPEDYTDIREDVRRMLALPPRPKNDKPCDYCKGYRTNFSISWNGKLRFCNLMQEPNLEVRDRPFLEAWQELVDYEDHLRWPEECYQCEIKEYCRTCAGAIATRSGSIQRIDTDYCETMKRLIREERMRG